MGFTYLDKMSSGGMKKIVYKFVDGQLTAKFSELTKAANDAGISGAYLSNYINKKVKKPKTIPENVEYRYQNKL